MEGDGGPHASYTYPGVKERDASSPHISRYACPMVLEGVEADAVRRLHPSK